MASYRPYQAAPPQPSGQQPPPPVNPMLSFSGAPPQNFAPFQFNSGMNPNMYGFPASQAMYGYPPSQFMANQNPSLPSEAAPPPPPLPPPGPLPPPPPPPGPPPSDEGPPPPPPPPSGPPPPPPPSTSETIKQEKHHVPPKHSKPAPAPPPTGGGHKGRVETEEERRARKHREYEKQKQEEKRRLALRQSQATVLQKTSQQKSGTVTAGPSKQDHGRAQGHGHGHGHGLVAGGSRMAGASQLIGVENRLKKQTTFMGKIKFRNELPDPTAQLKVLTLNTDKDRYTKYVITSLEKNWKATLIPPPDLGIPLDLIDLDAYIPPAECPPVAREDGELLRDNEVATPVKPEGIRRKERPTDKGVAWLVKTQYISSLSTESAKKSITEKQAKEMREKKDKSFLDNLNNREKQIRAIEESFEAAKLPPVHQTKRGMEAEWVLPLFPYFERSDDQFVMVNFDGDPTADSEQYSKLDQSTRDELESLAIMKSFVANGADPSKPDKFLAYMAPSPDELLKDPTDYEDEETSYSWIREYHWDVRGDDADDPNTYLVTFDDKAARYLPLPTKLALQKKRAKEGRSGDDIEHFPVPSKITVRRNAKRQRMETDGSSSKHEKTNLKRARTLTDADQFSGDEISY